MKKALLGALLRNTHTPLSLSNPSRLSERLAAMGVDMHRQGPACVGQQPSARRRHLASCEAPIVCTRGSSGLGLKGWKSPNPQSTQKANRMNTHKHARLTFASGLEMVKQRTL